MDAVHGHGGYSAVNVEGSLRDQGKVEADKVLLLSVTGMMLCAVESNLYDIGIDRDSIGRGIEEPTQGK